MLTPPASLEKLKNVRLININKTQVMALNCDPPMEVRILYKWNWDADYIKYLGVTLPKDFSKMFDLNY